MFVLQLPFGKKKASGCSGLLPLKMIQHRDLLSLASPLLFTLVVPGDGFFSAYGPCRHLTFPSRNNGNDTRIWVTEASVLVAGNPHCLLSYEEVKVGRICIFPKFKCRWWWRTVSSILPTFKFWKLFRLFILSTLSINSPFPSPTHELA